MFDSSLKTRLVTYTFFLVLLVAVSFLSFYVLQMSNLVEDQLVEFGFYLGESLSFSSATGITQENPTLIQSALQDPLKEDEVLLAAVYNNQGEVIVSSHKEETTIELPEKTKEKLAQEESFKIKGETEQGTDIYNFYVPIRSDEEQGAKLVGFARVAVSLEQIAVQRRKIFKFGGIATLIITLIGSFLAYLIATKITKPIQVLTQGAEEISKGNLDHRIKTETEGETRELANTFNQMAENLQHSRDKLKEAKKSLEVQVKARTKELRELNEELEERVQKRTQEMQKRVNELERFHRLTVGREMKMMELKDEIKELKKKLKEAKKENED